MDSYSERLGAWMLGLQYGDVPTDLVSSTKLRLLDTIGVSLAASTLPIGAAMRDAVVAMGAGSGAHILGFGDTVAPVMSALANGGLAHAMLADDTHNETFIHVTGPVFGAGVALCERAHRSGGDFLTAIVGGAELTCRVGVAAPGRVHKYGFHGTSVYGTFGATYTAAKLLPLDAFKLRHAIGIAGSMASGLNQSWADGSWTNFMHAGWAAHGAVTAAMLAAHGYTGPREVFEGHAGFFRAHVQDPDYQLDYPRMADDLGSRWESRNISLKPYPNAHFIHPFVDALLAIREEHGVEPEDVERIVTPVADYMIPIVCEPAQAKKEPQGQGDSRASLPFALASAMQYGKLGFEEYLEERLADPRVRSLAHRIDYVCDTGAPPPRHFKGWVIVELKDGRRFEHTEAINRGNVDNPMRRDDVVEKFREHARFALPEERIDRIESLVEDLETASSIRPLVDACLRPANGAAR